MMLGLGGLDPQKYTHRLWVVSSGDSFSTERAIDFEQTLGLAGHFDIVTVPRARRVHQTLLTTPVSALSCLLACIRVLSTSSTLLTAMVPHTPFPNVIVTNGPGTAVIMVLASIILRFFDLTGRANNPAMLRTVYFESWARVHQLSTSGKLLVPLVDRFIVQWPQLLARAGGHAEYRGWLVHTEEHRGRGLPSRR